MKRYLFFVITVLLFTSCSHNTGLDIISLNIRYDNPNDGENAWPNRRDIVVSFLDSTDADIFGLQEVLLHQYTYIDSLLPDYESVFAGRDDGLNKGEMVPVFYNTTRFERQDQNTFWLSETPEVPGSKGWGAALPRIVTWVKLFDKKSGDELFFFNTHFSHMSDSARFMSSKILAERVSEISGNHKFIVAGDFNMIPESAAYSELTDGNDNLIRDSYQISNSDPQGLSYTYNGFKDNPAPRRIDYIFVREDILVESFMIAGIKSNGIFISDHWPVLVKISLN